MTRHIFSFFFFNDTATTEIYTLSLHDALPIFSLRRPHVWCSERAKLHVLAVRRVIRTRFSRALNKAAEKQRSEEHTSELQSRQYLVCRLLLEKKKKELLLEQHSHPYISFHLLL